jgi:hypothetical protein
MNSPTPNLNSPETNIYNQGVPNESPTPTFAPLPIRVRTTLEILDTSVKLYRRYFKVLMLWSLLVAAVYVASSIIPLVYVLALPLIYGAVSCAIAAAVRGENITFGQVWDFTKPRYGPIIGVTLLSYIIAGIVALVLFIAGAIIFGLGAYIITFLPEPLSVAVIIVGIVALVAVYCVVCAYAFGWFTMVPIVACLEDDKRGVASLGRAWTLMSGHWRRVMTITVLCGIAMFIFFGIVGGFAFLIGSSANAFNDFENSAFWALMVGTTAVFAVFSVFYSPAQALIIAVLYLDLRVRKEALDIEWSDYTSKAPTPVKDGSVPQVVASSVGMAPSVNSNPFEIAPTNQPDFPSSFSSAQNVVAPQVQNVVEVTPPLAPDAPNPFLPVEPISELAAEPVVENLEPINLQPLETTSPVNVISPVTTEAYSGSEEEVSSFAPPAFSVGAEAIPSPWSAQSESSTSPSSDVNPVPEISSFEIQPDEPKPEDSHEPRF